jgi:EVE domain
MKYWVNTVSKDHVLRGVEGGFTQANHGSPYNLKKMSRGDYIVFYSPKTNFKNGKPLRYFTALGKCIDDKPYQAEMSPDFHPWRRNIKFVRSKETPIKNLINNLSFIKDKKRWGFPFRRGMFEIPEDDFLKITGAMEAELNGN